MRKCPRKGSVVIEKSTGRPLEVTSLGSGSRKVCTDGAVSVTIPGKANELGPLDLVPLASVDRASEKQASVARAAGKYGFLSAPRDLMARPSIPEPELPMNRLGPSPESAGRMYGLGSAPEVHAKKYENTELLLAGDLRRVDSALGRGKCYEANVALLEASGDLGMLEAHAESGGADEDEVTMQRGFYNRRVRALEDKCSFPDVGE